MIVLAQQRSTLKIQSIGIFPKTGIGDAIAFLRADPWASWLEAGSVPTSGQNPNERLEEKAQE
jgi:hypothetical protein